MRRTIRAGCLFLLVLPGALPALDPWPRAGLDHRPDRRRKPAHARRVPPPLFHSDPDDLQVAPVVIPPLPDPGPVPVRRIVTLPPGPDLTLDVAVHLGEVVIEPAAGDALEITSRIEGLGADTPWNRSQLALDVTERGRDPRHIMIRGRYFGFREFDAARPYLERGDRPARLALQLKVPSRLRASVFAGEATVSLRGLSGRVHVRTVTGAITARDCTGRMKLWSEDGRVEVTGCDLHLGIRANRGPVLIQDFRGRLDLRSHSGPVSVDYRDVSLADQRLRKEEGPLEITFPVGVRLHLEAHVKIENLDTHLPFEDVQRGSRRFVGDLGFRRPLVRGSVLVGEDRYGVVDLFNHRGVIRVGFREEDPSRRAAPAPAGPDPSAPPAPAVPELPDPGLDLLDGVEIP